MPITKTGKVKNGLQQYRVRINYTTPSGQYRQIERTAYGKAEAQDLERRLADEIGKGAASPGRITVRELNEEYLNSIKHEVRETTLANKQAIFARAVLPTLGDTRIDRLTVPLLQRWKNDIAAGDFTLQTKQSYYKIFHAMLNYAVKLQYIPSNPLTMIGSFKDTNIAPQSQVLHYYTADEFRRYIGAAQRDAEKEETMIAWGNYIFFCIAFYTGMRKGEINALRWSDLEGNIIHVHRSISQKLKGEDRETLPKNRPSYRDLQAPKPLMEQLAAHKTRQQACEGWKESWRICGGPTCLRDSNIERHNRQFAEEAGLPHIRIHDFRHTNVKPKTKSF